ncbi:rhomboid family intramembrane serine protease [Zoogloea sp.]|uniref:rhomboid family intramembrane serine protease n=1 Tax=Zoogloea sp. TaxID=49181 RepID=UPI00262666BD|nr:rhomboid family intramembrane serine protease [Zoogloea sp.]MDD3353325.1 rhomboid family intramembrane serine protease [Zoogloea sp.]
MNYDTFINLLFSRVRRADVTLALVVANSLVFLGLAALAGSLMQIPSDVLIRLGGNFAPAVQSGERWRLVTALFLHGGLLHVGLNMLALYQAGQVVERLFGRVGFAVLYLVAGLLASLASLWWRQGPVSVGASGAVFGVYGALLTYLLHQRGSVPAEVFREMRSGTVAFLGYSLFAGFSIAGIDNAAHLGGLLAGAILGLAFARPLVETPPVAWGSPRALGGLLLCGLIGYALWQQTPPVAQALERGSAYQQALQHFALEDQELQREQLALLAAVQSRQVSEAAALDTLEDELIPRWERQIALLSGERAPGESDWQRTELIHYASARRDASQALVQALQSRQEIWLERARTLQLKADNILLQMRLRQSMAPGGR